MSQSAKYKIKTWFVTGASSGFGHELCEQLLIRGYNIIAVSRRIPDFQHENSLSLYCDVTDPKSIEAAVIKGIKRFGSIDVLSNNAGISSVVFIEDETIEHVAKVMQVNYFGIFNTMKVFIPYFRENGHGTIINNSSMHGLSPRGGGCAYCSSKYAVEGLSAVATFETQKFCRVLVVEIGAFRGTEVSKVARQIDQQYISTDLKNTFEAYKNLKPLHPTYKYDFFSDLRLGIKYLIDEVEKDEPQRRLMLGKDSIIKISAEIESLQHDLELSKNRAFNVSKKLKYKRHRVLRALIKCIVDKKRYEKLKKDPGSFFSDSQSTVIKFLGRFYN